MVTEAVLPIADDARIVLRRMSSDPLLLSAVWFGTLEVRSKRFELGGVTISQCLRRLTTLAEPSSLRFYRGNEHWPECATILTFYGSNGPRQTLIAIRQEDGVELGCVEERNRDWQGLGVRIDFQLLAMWPAVLTPLADPPLRRDR